MKVHISVVAAFLLGSGAALAQERVPDSERIADLERRLRAIEADKLAEEDAPAGFDEWLRRIRISGSANVGYFDGRENSPVGEGTFNVWDARLFLEADLGHDVMIGSCRAIRDMRFLFEWDAVRIARFDNMIGELYVEFSGIADTGWLNLRVGRFQVPIGENYLRFSQGYKDNPFISNTVGGTWYWDEGLRLHGATEDGRYGYFASLVDGETDLNLETDREKEVTLKLFAEPLEWLHLSVSGARAGEVGTGSVPGFGSLWFGEMAPTGIGAFTSVPTFQDGAAVPDGPPQVEDVHLVAADAILDFERAARLWLAGGIIDLDAERSSAYDREVKYWIAELVLRGSLVSDSIEPLYLGLRADGVGTYDRNEGYLHDFRLLSTLGYNVKSVEQGSIVAGWRVNEHVTIKAQYTFADVGVVRGATAAIRDAAEAMDFFAIEVAASF